MRNSRMAAKGKEKVETMTLPDCKDDVEDNNGITDMPPVPSHSEAYRLINKLTVAGDTR